MSLRSTLALVAALAPAPALAQPTAAQQEANDALFQKLTTEVQGAIQQKNVATLDRLLTRDFGFSLLMAGKPPQVLNRAEFLRLGETSYHLERFELRNLAARVMGSGAVVRFQALREATVGSIDRSGEFVVFDIWMKDGDSWRLAVRYLARPDPGLSPAR
jgi:hypothetical protein